MLCLGEAKEICDDEDLQLLNIKWPIVRRRLNFNVELASGSPITSASLRQILRRLSGLFLTVRAFPPLWIISVNVFSTDVTAIQLCLGASFEPRVLFAEQGLGGDFSAETLTSLQVDTRICKFFLITNAPVDGALQRASNSGHSDDGLLLPHNHTQHGDWFRGTTHPKPKKNPTTEIYPVRLEL
ncbi:uncharacterized protein BDZ83DRAFT_649826 [Colletotrichum acutatum]|uniref:Uncharacterized protein n=1 Tax=Glomerella acutata TaxID=27357 RepID=A0AAD8UMV6_GLOAC|nr:uncharacterized protein BDZ83DRAFT_649826 [Colletotrichum acutatum]KAK1727247.1 hypothetical protein BDZ83DRAFT_649826 [Colletotrichum acutatum]